ncbi:hypothetical protein E2I00_006866 [Balaenoptera physalus]|uniref:Tumor necrosis factor alpha-induced protein 2 n=1 Tax=Balaenoptera physalus TaxID=9770 RepID=A0A643BSV2_BALPH|nr:hypothetical protein E2I00_006866 [Balaenoptera physalus]
MLKMTFQGFPGQQPAPGALDFPGSPQKLPFASEAESEASMSEASSEDLVPPLEAEEAPDRDGEEAAKKKKKKKKSKGLANMFSVFTKGRKKKSQPSSAETEGDSEPQPRPAGRPPTGRQGPQVPAGQGLGRMGAHWSGCPTQPGQRGRGSDIINSPKLAGELQGVRLGSLLSPKQIRLLEATFLSNEVGSPATWLHRALPTLAEIIRLQDPSAIKIEVATYATWYPDFSKGHLSAILAVKGTLSSSEVRSIRSILDINTGAHEPSKSLFSLIKVLWPETGPSLDATTSPPLVAVPSQHPSAITTAHARS